MRKIRVISLLGAAVGIFTSVYGLGGLTLYQRNAGPETPVPVFWTSLLLVSAALTVTGLTAFLVVEARRRRLARFDFLAAVRSHYEEAGRPKAGVPRGCSASEIDDAERLSGGEFPIAYRQFLAFMGRDYSGVLQDRGVFVDDLGSNRRALADTHPERTGNYVVFFNYADETFAYFKLPKRSEDPDVRIVRGGKVSAGGTLTQFLEREIREAINDFVRV